MRMGALGPLPSDADGTGGHAVLGLKDEHVSDEPVPLGVFVEQRLVDRAGGLELGDPGQRSAAQQGGGAAEFARRVLGSDGQGKGALVRALLDVEKCQAQ